MVLIDSSPWIDMLSGRSTAEAQLLEAWLRDGRPVATTGAVLQRLAQYLSSSSLMIANSSSRVVPA